MVLSCVYGDCVLQNGGFCQHLEVIILTSQRAILVQRQVEAAMATLDMEHVRVGIVLV